MGQVWKLRDLKPVPLQKAAQIGNFTFVVKPKVPDEDSSFPADGIQAILNKMSKKSECGRTLEIRIKHNRSTALEQSVINNLVAGGGGGRRRGL